MNGFYAPDLKLAKTEHCPSATSSHERTGSIELFGHSLDQLQNPGAWPGDGGDDQVEFLSLLKRFFAATVDRRCLRLLWDASEEPVLGPNWDYVDLRGIEQTLRARGEIAIDRADGIFDAVLCTGLDRLSQPAGLGAEIGRLLGDRGQLWAQVPLCGPGFPTGLAPAEACHHTTPDGLRQLFHEFDEILSSVYLPGHHARRSFSFLYGIRVTTGT